MLSWINTVNTTSYRIVSSTLASIFLAIVVTLAMVFGWQPSKPQMWVLAFVEGGLLTMMGFDVIQFASKRFSDSGLALARAGIVPPPPNETPVPPAPGAATDGPAPTINSTPTDSSVIVPTARDD